MTLWLSRTVWPKAVRLIAFFLCVGALAQTSTQLNAPSQTGEQTSPNATSLIRLGGQLMVADQAYEYDRELADEIGPRLTGSATYTKAADWTLAELKRLGLSNAHEEPWQIEATWEPEAPAIARIVSPHVQPLHLVSDGWSPSTPPGGIQANVFFLKDFTPEGVKAAAVDVKNSVVLVDRSSFKRPVLYGKVYEAIDLLKSEGARALLLGLGGINNAESMDGMSCCNGKLAALPIGDLGAEDGTLLRRELEQGPVNIEFSFTNRIREQITVNNVIAEIPGTDASGTYVLIGAHLDSWGLGTGAEDDGTGVASVLAIAKAVKETGLKPRRTMRFVLFGGEEEGLLGSLQYARRHSDDLTQCAGVFITDSGSEPPLGWDTLGRHDEDALFASVQPMLKELDAGKNSDSADEALSTDAAAFLVKGVPTFVLRTGTEKYRLIHHKTSDTFDKVDERDLNLGTAVVGMTAFAFADQAQTARHLSQSEVEQQLKEAGILDEYKDMQTFETF